MGSNLVQIFFFFFPFYLFYKKIVECHKFSSLRYSQLSAHGEMGTEWLDKINPTKNVLLSIKGESTGHSPQPIFWAYQRYTKARVGLPLWLTWSLVFLDAAEFDRVRLEFDVGLPQQELLGRAWPSKVRIVLVDLEKDALGSVIPEVQQKNP